MPAFLGHHCPVCGRIGDKRCISVEHYLECETHVGSFHSKQHDCVKCHAAMRRREREAVQARERDKENEKPYAGDKPPKKAKKKSKPRSKPSSEKTIKQIRREKRAARKPTSYSTSRDESSSAVDESQDWDEGVTL